MLKKDNVNVINYIVTQLINNISNVPIPLWKLKETNVDFINGIYKVANKVFLKNQKIKLWNSGVKPSWFGNDVIIMNELAVGEYFKLDSKNDVCFFHEFTYIYIIMCVINVQIYIEIFIVNETKRWICIYWY